MPVHFSLAFSLLAVQTEVVQISAIFHPKHFGGNITEFHKGGRSLGRCCAAKTEGSHNECGSESDFSFHSDDLCNQRFLNLFETQCLEHNQFNESLLYYLTSFLQKSGMEYCGDLHHLCLHGQQRKRQEKNGQALFSP